MNNYRMNNSHQAKRRGKLRSSSDMDIQSAERVKALTMGKIRALTDGAGGEGITSGAGIISSTYNTAPQRSIVGRAQRYSISKFAAAAITAAVILSLTSITLAYSGVFNNIFATFAGGIVNGGLGNDSRKTIVDEGFAEVVTNPAGDPEASVNDLTLTAYYVDEREFGFDFTLTNSYIEEGFYYIRIPEAKLEITNADGGTNTFAWDTEPSSNMGGFPILPEVRAVKTETGFDVSVILEFYNTRVPVGKTARFTIESLNFHYYMGDESWNVALPDRIITLDGGWVFDIDIADKFTDAVELVYTAPNDVEGISITSVSVLPTACHIEAVIDYSKNTLADPDNINKASEPQYLPKINMLDTYLYAVDGEGKTYGFQRASYDFDESHDSVTKCWFELASMFFDAPETLTLIFTGYDDTTIEVPLVMSWGD